MNKIVLENLDKYVETLLQEKEFSHLEVSVSAKDGENSQSQQINVSSNAKITLHNSLRAEMQIVQQLKKLLDDYGDRSHVILNLSFNKKIEKKSGASDDLLSKFYVSTPLFDLDDVILPKDKYDEIQNALSLIKNHELIYNEWGWREKEPSAKSVLCFYGAPGTGKTMCAHGIAKHLNKNILIASYADIQSEYVGVGPKNLKAVFEEAEKENAVLFFDEADSFLRKRTSDTSSSASMHYNSMTNEMMKHLEDFNGLVIFATNLTENTDEAFKTRITCSIEFTVPDEECRAKIISYMIPSKVPFKEPLSSKDYLSISKECDGFVGRDIRNAIKFVLTEGAKNESYPFSVDSFIQGFQHYKESKEKFSESIDGKKDSNSSISPMDLYSETNCVQALITYAAWMDGEENELEAKILKEKAKVLSRNKLIIGKLSDLSTLEEICDGIKHLQVKKTAMGHLADVLAVSGCDDDNIAFINDIANRLSIDDEILHLILSFYECSKRRFEVMNSIENINE